MTRLPVVTRAKLSRPLARSVALIWVAACLGNDDALSGWDGVERDSAGITIVENFGTPLWGEEPLWRFHEVLRIGTADGDPDYQFGAITGLAVLSDGRVVVADRLAHNVRYFSPDGVLERTVGRQGSGPGEFGAGYLYLARMKGDTILVIDNANNRVVHVFAPDGTQLPGFSLGPRNGRQVTNWDNARGRLVVKIEPMVLPNGPPADSLTYALEIDARGEVLDTLARLPFVRTVAMEGDARLQYFYRGETGFDFCGGGLWVGSSGEGYRLAWHGPGGAVHRIMTLVRDRVSLDAPDEAVMLAWYDEVLQANQVPSGRAAEIKSHVRFEDTYPAYRQFVCGPESTILVQRFVPLREIEPTKENNPLRVGRNTRRRPPPSDRWDVFDAQGRYVGVVTPPWDQVWRTGEFVRTPNGGWYLYAIMQDELDVEYVVAWRVEGRMPAAD